MSEAKMAVDLPMREKNELLYAIIDMLGSKVDWVSPTSVYEEYRRRPLFAGEPDYKLRECLFYLADIGRIELSFVSGHFFCQTPVRVAERKLRLVPSLPVEEHRKPFDTKTLLDLVRELSIEGPVTTKQVRAEGAARGFSGIEIGKRIEQLLKSGYLEKRESDGKIKIAPTPPVHKTKAKVMATMQDVFALMKELLENQKVISRGSFIIKALQRNFGTQTSLEKNLRRLLEAGLIEQVQTGNKRYLKLPSNTETVKKEE